jgi:hypothetical protein
MEPDPEPDPKPQADPKVGPGAVEIRVVGCLIEKQRTTPDVYPLSLNSLRLACNQSTNRDPVVDYDEATVTEALRGWRCAAGPGWRAVPADARASTATCSTRRSGSTPPRSRCSRC